MRSTVSVIAILAAAGLAWAPAASAAEEVGRFAVVQNEVRSVAPGAGAPVQAKAGDSIVLGETDTTGEASAAKMLLGEGAVVSLGQNTSFRVSREALDEATGRSTSLLDVVAGKVRVFVSRFWSDRPDLEVRTPTAVVGVKGSEVGVEILEGGDTLVSVFSGTATVRGVAAPGTPRSVRAGEQVRLSASGEEGEPARATPQALSRLRAVTEPDPVVARSLPPRLSVREAPAPVAGSGTAERTAVNTTSAASAGEVWADPATTAVPEGGDSRQIGRSESAGPPGR